MGWGPTSVPLFILYGSPIMRTWWVGGDLCFSLSDAVPSLAGFIHQEEEEVIPQMVPEAVAHRKGWARVQGM